MGKSEKALFEDLRTLVIMERSWLGKRIRLHMNDNKNDPANRVAVL